jgi:hypothetical protein
VTEYFEGFGFGLTDETEEPEPHVHQFITRPWRVREFPGMEIYDCGCGVRRFVPKGENPHDFGDAPVQSFPESCPQWSINDNYATQPPLTLTSPPEK